MLTPEKIPVVGVVDNVDPDNAVQILALMAPPFDLQCVIVTGRTVADGPRETDFRTTLNAVRMRNVMDAARPDHGVPVFRGLPAPYGVVPNHFDELAFDDLHHGQLDAIRRRDDLRQLGLAGDTGDAIKFLRGGTVDEFSLIVGGPLTVVARMLRDPMMAAKTRDIFSQLGKIWLWRRSTAGFWRRHAPRSASV